MECVKYFTLFFVCTGILPIIYGLLGMNNKNLDSSKRLDEIIEEKLEDNNTNNLFKSSLFVKYFDKLRIPMFTGNTRIHYSQLLSNEELDDTFKERNDKEMSENKIEND